MRGKDRLQGLTGGYGGSGGLALFNLVEQLSGGQNAGILVAEIQVEGVGKQEGEHGVAAEATDQDVGAPLLLQVFGGAYGQGVAGADQRLGAGGDQLGRQPVAAVQAEIPEGAVGRAAQRLAVVEISLVTAQASGEIAALNSLGQGSVVPAPGGVLIRDQAGRVLGAVGITGDTSDIDEQCAISAIEAEGLCADAGATA